MATSSKKKTMTKQELKGHVDKAEMDLSLCELSTIPVRDMLTYTRVTVLDLACNKLEELPEELCEMRQLQRLDLSKNVLIFLPQAIGRLEKLRQLDLFSNRLSSLPLSFSQLAQLKWLDLKNNMLDSQIAGVAGTCVDERECEECATNVVRFIKTKAAEAERARQENIMREKRALELQRELTEKENAERRRQKQELKQRRREEREAELRQRKVDTGEQEKSNDPYLERSQSASKERHAEQQGSCSCLLWILMLFVVLLAALGGAYAFYCMPDDRVCREQLTKYSQQGTEFMDRFVEQLKLSIESLKRKLT
ncbi:leucine-rich repeat-containing protein 59-like [Sycon ciliatum]|uniref:leucine-rich repeat-containing protein 59-like n=2 Tax=Sycon ciliatum TaxID=27933 RepID=UPI0031F71AD5